MRGTSKWLLSKRFEYCLLDQRYNVIMLYDKQLHNVWDQVWKIMSVKRPAWFSTLLHPSSKIMHYSLYYDCIVLFWWGGRCCPMHCDIFMINCAPPNLGNTRKWICRLNFAQRPIFSGLRFFNEPEISDSGPPAWSPPRRTCDQDFYILEKSIDLSRVWTREPWISRRAR